LVYNDVAQRRCGSQSIEPGDDARQAGVTKLVEQLILLIARERGYMARDFAITKFVEADSAVSIKQCQTVYQIALELKVLPALQSIRRNKAPEPLMAFDAVLSFRDKDLGVYDELVQTLTPFAV